jgi:hypothetical protein
LTALTFLMMVALAVGKAHTGKALSNPVLITFVADHPLGLVLLVVDFVVYLLMDIRPRRRSGTTSA